MEETINKIMNKMEYMDHHYEHHFVTNSDNIDHVKAKLDDKEDSALHRIDELEGLVKKVCYYFTIFMLFYPVTFFLDFCLGLEAFLFLIFRVKFVYFCSHVCTCLK